MKKQMRVHGVILAATLTACFAAGVVLAGAATAPTDEIVIDGKKPARFSHPKHLEMGLDCAFCHHDEKHEPLSAEAIGGLADTGVLKCVSCHNNEHPKEDLRKAKDVFHGKCKTCHAEGFAGKNGPTKCTSCHLKKKTYEGC